MTATSKRQREYLDDSQEAETKMMFIINGVPSLLTRVSISMQVSKFK